MGANGEEDLPSQQEVKEDRISTATFSGTHTQADPEDSLLALSLQASVTCQ